MTTEVAPSSQRPAAAGPKCPPAVPFVHRGEYLGWFVGLAAAAASLSGIPETSADVRDTHMRASSGPSPATAWST